MARNEAYRIAEEKIEAALRSGAKRLDLSAKWDGKDSEKLTELPESLGQLRQLQFLALSFNCLTALPEWIGNFTRLQSLNLRRNKLTALPESMARLTQIQELDLSGNQVEPVPAWLAKFTQLQLLNMSGLLLTDLPNWLRWLTQLEALDLSNNRLLTVPGWLSQLTQLKGLLLNGNKLVGLPDEIGELAHLSVLSLAGNQLTTLPKCVCRLQNLKSLGLTNNAISVLPDEIGNLKALVSLALGGRRIITIPNGEFPFVHSDYARQFGNNLNSLPESCSQLTRLTELFLDENPLNPELAAAYKEGLDAVKRYLRAKAEAQVVLNEAKLILIGEGEVGKSCLLDALRGVPFVKHEATHGIRLEAVKVTAPDTGTEITLNGWDFGGQRVYRPTHQLFFSTTAVYVVVWKPREGSQQNLVKEWIRLVKHREPDAKIFVVATHGGPGQRLPDINRQDIWDAFGRATVIDFFHVDSQPDEINGERRGIEELKKAIARVAATLPGVGGTVPARWQQVREILKRTTEAYLPLTRVIEICHEQKMEDEEALDFIRNSHRLGHLIFYEHDPALRDIVVLKPDWLATAVSFVLDDPQTRDDHGLVSFARLSQLWSDPAKAEESHYPAHLHPMFLRLMERFDLSYTVAVPSDPARSTGFWQEIGSSLSKMFGAGGAGAVELRQTSLIAQLVPDIRPNPVPGWASIPSQGDGQQMQICRIVDEKGQSATAEGLFFQLIVRLHKFSLGRVDYHASVHWQRGLVLDCDYNGRALLEHVGNDVRITVRAPYPEAFLAVLTYEVKWLVENFWAGLKCDVMVPCVEPCGKSAPGTGLYDVRNLIESKRDGYPKFPCPVCNKWQEIDCLLRNAPAARPSPIVELLNRFAEVMKELNGMRRQLAAQYGEALGRFDKLDASSKELLSKVDAAFNGLTRVFTDEAKEGPRLFSLHPVERSAFNPNGWAKKKFRVTLWCEHTRLPLPLINKHEKEGVYEFEVTREWFAKAAPFLKMLAGTLSLVLPVAASATKLALDEAAYKELEKQLEFGKACAEAMSSATEKTAEWVAEKEGPDAERAGVIRADGGALREFQTWLKKEDPSFGDLRKVLNKRQEFLWVHRNFEKEY